VQDAVEAKKNEMGKRADAGKSFERAPKGHKTPPPKIGDSTDVTGDNKTDHADVNNNAGAENGDTAHKKTYSRKKNPPEKEPEVKKKVTVTAKKPSPEEET
jgi:hypothetical protein